MKYKLIRSSLVPEVYRGFCAGAYFGGIVMNINSNVYKKVQQRQESSIYNKEKHCSCFAGGIGTGGAT